jgi:hypothetical protein
MSNLMKKVFGQARTASALSARDGGSKALTGIDPGDPGSNVAPTGAARRPGRRGGGTPLGPVRLRQL